MSKKHMEAMLDSLQVGLEGNDEIQYTEFDRPHFPLGEMPVTNAQAIVDIEGQRYAVNITAMGRTP